MSTVVSYVLLLVHLMYTNYCRILLLYIRWSLYIASCVLLWVHLMYTDYSCMYKMVPVYRRRNIVNHSMWRLTLLPLQCITKIPQTLYLVLSCTETKKTMHASLLRDARCCKEVPFHQKQCGCTECTYMCCSAACQ